MTTSVATKTFADEIAAYAKAKRELASSVLTGTLAATRFPNECADATDEFLRTLFLAATGGKVRGYALIGVGGYGRRELSPGSDLDLVLLHRGRRGAERVASSLWYAIWDTGVRLDHSVRTKGEAISMARKNLKVVLGLLDGRLIAGDAGLADSLFTDVRALWQRDFRGYAEEFSNSVEQRHESAGELAFLLEPDLKQSAGGLRDIAALRALGVAISALAPLGDALSVLDAERLILATRVALQCETGSATDRLALQEQDEVAAILSYESADALMAKLADAGRTISVASAEGWRRVHALVRPPSSLRPLGGGVIGDGIAIVDGEVTLTDSARPDEDETLLGRVALAAAERHALINRESLERLADSALQPKAPWSKNLRDTFIALLGTGDALVPTIEALDQWHLFERFIPEWKAVRNKPQRNAYHRYTVDRHLLEAVARAGEYVSQVERPDLLLLGTLLHDIGKGFPGDHSEVGKEIAIRVASRMGFPDEDVDTLVRLVAYHLLLPEIATRRDLDDPSTAALVARLVESRSTLSLLAALTEADGQATGTSAWGPWKAELVSRLVERVGNVIDGQPPVEVPEKAPSEEELELLDRGEVAVRANGRRVTIVAPDQPGLFATVTGVLALDGCNVRRATISLGRPGVAIETFDVEPIFDTLPEWSRVESELSKALAGQLAVAERLGERDRAYAKGKRPSSARPTTTRVLVDNETSSLATIVEVRATDRIGLLHEITTAIADADFDIAAALVDTLGHEVIDTFYIHEQSGEKLGSERVGEIYDHLSAVLSRGG